MIVNGNRTQRGSGRSVRFIPPDDRFDPRGYTVELSSSDAEVRAFVVAHHYSGSFPSARDRAVMRSCRTGEIVGAAVLSKGMNDAALEPLGEAVRKVGKTLADDAAELGRFVLADDLAFNAESFFIGEAFRLFWREGWRAVLAFSDPVPRTDAQGRMVFFGHVGQIYRATNAIYAGRGTPRTLYILPDGTSMPARTIQKIRTRERNWQSAARVLQGFGADELTEHEDARRWLAHWLPALTRRMRHPGNLRYLFGLDRRVRRFLPDGEPYPVIKLPARPRAAR